VAAALRTATRLTEVKIPTSRRNRENGGAPPSFTFFGLSLSNLSVEIVFDLSGFLSSIHPGFSKRLTRHFRFCSGLPIGSAWAIFLQDEVREKLRPRPRSWIRNHGDIGAATDF
jgi:hypothetical protein